MRHFFLGLQVNSKKAIYLFAQKPNVNNRLLPFIPYMNRFYHKRLFLLKKAALYACFFNINRLIVHTKENL